MYFDRISLMLLVKSRWAFSMRVRRQGHSGSKHTSLYLGKSEGKAHILPAPVRKIPARDLIDVMGFISVLTTTIVGRSQG